MGGGAAGWLASDGCGPCGHTSCRRLPLSAVPPPRPGIGVFRDESLKPYVFKAVQEVRGAGSFSWSGLGVWPVEPGRQLA